MTKDEVTARVKAIADISGNSRWSSTVIDGTITRVHTAGWKRILNANNTYRSASRSVTTSSSGIVLLSALSSGSGNSAERFYRILGVRVGSRVYEEVEATDWVLGTGVGNPPRGKYFVANESLYIPDTISDTAVVWVNHTPTPFSSLTPGSTAVTWPTDYEDCLIYDAAADLLSMGANESPQGQDLRMLADAWWLDMLADIGRQTINPAQWTYSDSAAEWGG